MADFDLRTVEGIDGAQADLDRFKASVDGCVTRDLLPWSLGIGRRQVLINRARQAIATPSDKEGGE